MGAVMMRPQSRYLVQYTANGEALEGQFWYGGVQDGEGRYVLSPVSQWLDDSPDVLLTDSQITGLVWLA